MNLDNARGGIDSHNIRLVLLFTLLYNIGYSIWLGDLFSVYVFTISGDSNEILGDIEGTQGLVQVLTAIPVALLADKYRRDRMLSIAGTYGLVVLIFAAYVLAYTNQVKPIFVLVFLWGIFEAQWNPNLESIFAESLPAGNRSEIFTLKFIVLGIASSVGPLISLLIYLFLGNTWSMSVQRAVLLSGVAISALALMTLFFFNDDKTIGGCSHMHKNNKINEDEGIQAINVHSRRASSINSDWNENLLIHSERTIYDNNNDNNDDNNDIDEDTVKPLVESYTFINCITIKSSYIPYILVISDVITSIGSGMSVKFFPVFFVDEYNVTPTVLSALYVMQPLFCAMSTWLAQLLSLHFGRVNIVIFFKVCGISCLIAMTLIDDIYYIAPLWIIRYSFMNAIYPLLRSMLMDCVHKDERTRWNAVESVGQFTWSGSALIGGYLITSFSYRFCFVITACVYICTTIPMFLLSPFVPPEVHAKEGTNKNSYVSTLIDVCWYGILRDVESANSKHENRNDPISDVF